MAEAGEHPELITGVPDHFDHDGLNDDTIPRHISPEAPVENPFIREYNGVSFELQGAATVDGKSAYVFASRDQAGVNRPFYVYQSRSEGGLRSTAGSSEANGDEKQRILKGGELTPGHQYTQETQLNPQLTAMITELYDRLGEQPLTKGQISAPNFVFDESVTAEKTADFARERTVEGFPDNKVNEILAQLPVAGALTADIVKYKMGETDLAAAQHKLLGLIQELNHSLADADLIPDFSQPARSETFMHPILGKTTREVFIKQSSGQTYEWHMASDEEGRVWIDRIRLADAHISPYGTDKEMVYSGLLTAKPIDYDYQTDGLPDNLRDKKYEGTNYRDLTSFLNQLAPVASYRWARSKKS